MVLDTTIITRGWKQFDDRLSKLKVELPKAFEKDGRKIMYAYKKNFRLSLRNRGINPWKGKLHRFPFHKTSEGRYEMTMPVYGHYLDVGKWDSKHPVPLFEGARSKDAQSMIQWAKEKGVLEGEDWFYPKPKHWMVPAIRMTRKQINSIVGNGAAIKLIRKRGGKT